MLNKFLLAAIAAGLWANAIATMVHPAHADPDDYLAHIAKDIHALTVGGRECKNTKICD